MDRELIAFWDEEAAVFDEAADHGLADASTREAWRALLASVLPPAPARIADLGCGTGTLSLLLAEMGYQVDGVDFSPRMLERAARKAATRADLAFHLVLLAGFAVRPGRVKMVEDVRVRLPDAPSPMVPVSPGLVWCGGIPRIPGLLP